MKKMNPHAIVMAFMLMTIFSFKLTASKLVSVSVVDKNYVMVFLQDGEVVFNENAATSELIEFGMPLNTSRANNIESWLIKSNDDPAFGNNGIMPVQVFRKSKLSGMSQEQWVHSIFDYHFDWAYEHVLFLQLPSPLQNGKSYTIEVDQGLNIDSLSATFTCDFDTSRSEAVKVNVVGYSTRKSAKIADVYMWMGDGGFRDYGAFENNDAYIYNVETGEKQLAGKLQFWKKEAAETSNNHQMIRSDVWSVDFSAFNTPGKYRIIIDGIGCSDNFVIADDIYSEPVRVSTLGFFYMRIGQDNLNDMVPTPRTPLYIPGVSPSNTTVYITTMHPYHPQWNSFAGSGDKWDKKNEWSAYSTGRTNPNAYGGHSDALDWDRRLDHVSIIYDMLFPYIITDGVLDDDNMGIPESANGIPDILDEARNEVDFWLRLRDGQGYSHGINNPNSDNVFYQAGITAVAAWANAVNAAMLSNSFLIEGSTELMEMYRDSAIAAYSYASQLPDQMLDKSQGIGIGHMTGRDFKATAAAYLYNITGETAYEDDLNSLNRCTSPESSIQTSEFNQLYAVAAYLFSNREIHYPEMYDNMKQSLINEAKNKEAKWSNQRPSRRATDNNDAWFVTFLQVQRTILAHALSDEGSADRILFENALTLEADWSLGRNPLNMIIMTTATTLLENEKSVPNAYTSGWNDGTPGVHPGHTPYMNIYDWGGGIRGEPSWMTKKNYPNASSWPYGEMYYNTRYVWAANEFTPQQTMRGKQALYSYLYALSKPDIIPATGVEIAPKNDTIVIGESKTISAQVVPVDVTNNGVYWKSLNSSIVAVDIHGTLTGKKEGSAMVLATSRVGNVSDTAHITVKKISVEDVSIIPDTIRLTVDEKKQLSVEVLPENASNKQVSWRSENTGIAKVNSNGLVTALSAGTTTISATSADGDIEAFAEVIVDLASKNNLRNRKKTSHIYPNPSDGKVKVLLPDDVDSALMTIYDLTGKIIINNRPIRNPHIFCLDGYKSGIYVVRLFINDIYHMHSVIVK